MSQNYDTSKSLYKTLFSYTSWDTLAADCVLETSDPSQKINRNTDQVAALFLLVGVVAPAFEELLATPELGFV